MRIWMILGVALMVSACSDAPMQGNPKGFLLEYDAKTGTKQEATTYATKLCARHKRKPDLVSDNKRLRSKSVRQAWFQCV